MYSLTNAKIAQILGLVVAALLPAKANAEEAVALKSIVQWWEERALISGSQEEFRFGETVSILRWYTVPRVSIHTTAAADSEQDGIRQYLSEFFQLATKATNLGIALEPSASRASQSNVQVYVSDGPEDFVETFSQHVTDNYFSGSKDKFLDLIDKIGEKNCYWKLGFDTASGAIERALILAPISEDLWATKKCIGAHLLKSIGMVGEVSGDSVTVRSNAALLPTSQDAYALSVHYLLSVEGGVDQASVENAARQILSQPEPIQ